MYRSNSSTVWSGVVMAIVFFSFRFLFESRNYPLGDEIWRNAYAGGIALVVGVVLGYLLRNQSDRMRYLIAALLVVTGVLMNIIL